MEKYRLVKKYPGSPELGYVIDLSKIKCDKIEGYRYIDEKWEVYKKDIVNNPEYWERVEEKDYEILSLKGKHNGRIHRVIDNVTMKASESEETVPLSDWSSNDPIKLVSEFPLSWSIYSVRRLSDGQIFTIGDHCTPKGSDSLNNRPITKFTLITDNSELRVESKNWFLSIDDIEKSKPLDYEILALEDRLTGDIWEKRINDTFKRTSPKPSSLFPTIDQFDLDVYDIITIRRLSDSKVFTVGDKINNKYTISRFELGFSSPILTFVNEEPFWISLKTLFHSKKPLFTTEDGVDIFEGDDYFEVALTFKPSFREAIYKKIARPNIIYDYGISEKREKLNKNGRYYFSTKEAAEEYVLMNKPSLSVNDVLSVAYNPVETKTSITNKLKEIVKSKSK